VARQIATAVLWVRIQTSLKNHKWATEAKEWPTHSSPPKKYTKKNTLWSGSGPHPHHRQLGMPTYTEMAAKPPAALMAVKFVFVNRGRTILPLESLMEYPTGPRLTLEAWLLTLESWETYAGSMEAYPGATEAYPGAIVWFIT
jgi:hypothetical protein